MKNYQQKSIVLVLLIVFGLSCSQKTVETYIEESPKSSQQEISLNELGQFDNVIYQGRIGNANLNMKEFYWSGTSAKIRFKGNTLDFSMKDVGGDNYYHAVLDGELVGILRPDTILTHFKILNDSIMSIHEFELLRISEGIRGKTMFYGFDIGEGKYLKIPIKKNTISFYGNSITAAYAVDDLSGTDSPDSSYTNFNHSYAKITANHFDANYYAIVRSGIGISISWFDQLISELYYRIDPLDSLSYWDYSLDETDIVVVNLLQNDAMLVKKPEYPTYKKYFAGNKPSRQDHVDMYAEFLQTIRKVHPSADIICMLGNMSITEQNSPWPEIVNSAIEKLDDKLITTCFAPYKETIGHPNFKEQKVLADQLIIVIDDIFAGRDK